MNSDLVVFTLIVPLLLAACGRGSDQATFPAETIVRDSSGVAIIENLERSGSTGESPRAPTFRLAEAPTTTIGALDGEPPYLFTNVTAATRLTDGSIAILDTRQEELRLFDAEGRYLRTIAGRGQGPGELTRPSFFQRTRGDTLLIRNNLLRLEFFLGTGGHVRYLAFPREADRPRYSPLYRFADGRFIATKSVAVTPVELPIGETFLRTNRREVEYFLIEEDRTEIGLALHTTGAEYYEHLHASGTIWGGEVPFSATPVIAVGDSLLYHGRGDRYEIEVYSPQGLLQRLIRLDRQPDPVAPEDIQRYREIELAATSEEARPQYEITLNEIPFAPAKPSYTKLLLDEIGRLWVQDFALAGEPQLWRIFSDEGVYLGELPIPAGLTVFEIGIDYVLGRTTDDFGVHRVELWEVIEDAI